MKKNKLKIFGKILLIFLTLVFTLIASGFVMFYKTTASAKLDDNKLVLNKEVSNIVVLDSNGEEIDSDNLFTSSYYVEIEELPDYVVGGFIATEDKRFYNHNGVDYIRMAGALVNNIKNGKFSEGASTISQQLIKNTHLSREKTLNRKMKEIKLAYELERRYTKEEILELYLNNIYFGNGCYGLEKASRFYFDKSAKDLSVGESAMLVGVINAPSVYDPVSKNENSEKRKRLVLSLMKKQGIITNEEYEKNANSKEKMVKNTSKTSNQHLKCILSEACSKLKISENQLKNKRLTIHTSIDLGVQNELSNLLNLNYLIPKTTENKESLVSIFVVDNKTKNITAFASNGKNNMLNINKQPGSAIKPVLVYAPALESGLIYPDSIIIDEPININGYSPKNANKVFSGPVSVRESVEKSLNIPAVKTLSKLGVVKAKNFASKLGVEFSDKDKNLALALGGMTDGVSIQTLADAYSTFASNGEYKKSNIITKITDENNRVLYEDAGASNKVMSEATAYLMTDILKGVVSNGTARRLKGINYDVASKTGTVGVSDSSLNTEAINVSYTTEHTVVCWITTQDGLLSSNVNGATYPTEIVKRVLNVLYKDHNPKDFSMPDGVVVKNIDTRSLQENKIQLAGNLVESKYTKPAIFNESYLPELTTQIMPHKTRLEVNMEEGQKPTLMFGCKKDNSYSLIRKDVLNGNTSILCQVENSENKYEYKDEEAVKGYIYEYCVISYNDYQSSKQQVSNSVKLMSY